MQLPEKTFLTKNRNLYESDFESNGQVKPLRIMQLLQDIATEHAEKIGMSWDILNERNVLWVLSKMKIVFAQNVTEKTNKFTLYTWPLAPHGFFVERCFEAVDENGFELFSATSLWLIISKTERKIMPTGFLNDLYAADYSAIHSSAGTDFHRIRKDQTFEFSYEKQIRRSDLDRNGHVNNTNYITFALDTLDPKEKISQAEIVYNKELRLGDVVQIFTKREGDKMFVVGEHTETSFSAMLQVY